jgi:ADP-ribosylglycohydrolase
MDFLSPEITCAKLTGLLLGTAVGDALGLPFEGLSPHRIARRLGDRPLGHRLLLGRGMTSDDTEHACLVAQSLLESPSDPAAFAKALARRLRWWLAGVPAGVGLATLRATTRLWLGRSPERSGVPSAGNGPAMRAPLLGACLPDRQSIAEFVRASTRLTHTDPRAEQGAVAMALAARQAMSTSVGTRIDRPAAVDAVRSAVTNAELAAALALMSRALERGDSGACLAADLGSRRGVSGYIVHTVPVALYLWLAHGGEVRGAVSEAVRLGGDTDTVAALAGALCGATHGAEGVPADWLAGLWEWPRTPAWMCEVASRLSRQFHAASPASPGPAPLFWPGLLPRNALFAAVVLAHGFRRLLPPY